jgi:prepilin-type N-terminal cleavage/methylation domain-containing protein
MAKITYAVVLNEDYTAELRFKEHKNGFVNKVVFNLNAELPLTHITNRQIVNSMLNEHNLIVGQFNIETFPNNTQIIYGEATKLRKQKLFEWSEAGFSLIELAVSSAILTVITLTAATFYTQASDSIKADIEEVKAMQAANPEVQYFVEFE